MTTFDQPAIDFPSAPITPETRAVLNEVADNWQTDDDWQRFDEAVRQVHRDFGEVDPSKVRAWLTVFGDLTINPRRLSAFYSRAVAQGLLEFSHWGINGDTKGRNAGRPARIYKLRGGVS